MSHCRHGDQVVDDFDGPTTFVDELGHLHCTILGCVTPWLTPRSADVDNNPPDYEFQVIPAELVIPILLTVVAIR